MRLKALALTLTLAASVPALAADANGSFAVKSVGGAKCSAFVDAVKSKEQSRWSPYLVWVAGYLSASNQLEAETFDLASWQDMRTLASWLTQHCDRNADLHFGRAVGQLVSALKRDRLVTRSDVVSVEHGGQSLQIYEEVLRRVQAGLAELGMYSGSLDGRYGESTREALERFQADKQLEQTGLPDQRTLFALFRTLHESAQ